MLPGFDSAPLRREFSKLMLRTSLFLRNSGGTVTGDITMSGAKIIAAYGQLSGVVGQARNARMSITAASASATFTADEIIVEATLGGLRYCLSSFSKTINLATTGAGGMDTGAAPVSGYVALYAIYNLTTGISALLAVNATAAVAPEIYGGANMPSGYTASALISVWPTNASSQFIVGFQIDRTIAIPSVVASAALTLQASPTALSIAGIIPKNAKNISGFSTLSSGAGIACTVFFHASAQGAGGQQANIQSASAVTNFTTCFTRLPITTQQNLYYTFATSSGTAACSISSYEF